MRFTSRERRQLTKSVPSPKPSCYEQKLKINRKGSGGCPPHTCALVLEFGCYARMSHPILLYDGVCGLCNRMVQFVLRGDREGTFRFAALQSGFAARILARHGIQAGELDTVYVVVNFELAEERVLSRSDAVIFVLKRVGIGRFIGPLLQCVPRPLREWGYGVVARNRYRMFGPFDSCVLPSEENRTRFLDV
jgi:predicted DCC family thiol-disulfide oxidoreductase YuxK